MSHQHLTIEERSQIEALLSMQHNQKEIAQYLNRAESTISREVRRNLGQRGYRHQQAHRLATKRRQVVSNRAKKWTPELESYVTEKLSQEHSPEQISGRLKMSGHTISHERIYQYIGSNKQNGGLLYLCLRHQGKKYAYKRGKKEAGRGCIPNRVDISKRPKSVDRKSRLGDWEGDLIIGKNHKGAILSMVDRKSKFTLLSLLPGKAAAGVVKAT